MTASYFLSALGALLAFASVLLLRHAWRLNRQGRPIPLLRWGGWTAFAFAATVWTAAYTPDWGIAVALCLFMLVGTGWMIWLAARAPRRAAFEAGKARTASAQAKPGNSWRLGARRVAIFLLAGPLAGVAALLLSIWIYGATFGSGGGQTASQLFFTLLAFPFLWALLSLVATYDASLLKRSGVVAASAALGLIGTYIVL